MILAKTLQLHGHLQTDETCKVHGPPLQELKMRTAHLLPELPGPDRAPNGKMPHEATPWLQGLA